MPTSMSLDEMTERVCVDPDFIALKRFDYSLKTLLARYPDGVPSNRVIAQALLITEEELAEVYEDIVKKLRKSF